MIKEALKNESKLDVRATEITIIQIGKQNN